jgi:hypothetical protein
MRHAGRANRFVCVDCSRRENAPVFAKEINARGAAAEREAGGLRRRQQRGSLMP